MICFVTSNLGMPCFRTPHSTIWVDTFKHLTLAIQGELEINMISTDDELIAEFPKSKVTQVYLSFSPDGGFTPPSSSSTEAMGKFTVE